MLMINYIFQETTFQISGDITCQGWPSEQI